MTIRESAFCSASFGSSHMHVFMFHLEQSLSPFCSWRKKHYVPFWRYIFSIAAQCCAFEGETWVAQGPVCYRSFYQERAGSEHTEHLETARLTCPWGFVADLAVATLWAFPSPMTTTMGTMEACIVSVNEVLECSLAHVTAVECIGERLTRKRRIEHAFRRLLGNVWKYLTEKLTEFRARKRLIWEIEGFDARNRSS